LRPYSHIFYIRSHTILYMHAETQVRYQFTVSNNALENML
jgi:hypothetical protein